MNQDKDEDTCDPHRCEGHHSESEDSDTGLEMEHCLPEFDTGAGVYGDLKSLVMGIDDSPVSKDPSESDSQCVYVISNPCAENNTKDTGNKDETLTLTSTPPDNVIHQSDKHSSLLVKPVSILDKRGAATDSRTSPVMIVGARPDLKEHAVDQEASQGNSSDDEIHSTTGDAMLDHDFDSDMEDVIDDDVAIIEASCV